LETLFVQGWYPPTGFLFASYNLIRCACLSPLDPVAGHHGSNMLGVVPSAKTAAAQAGGPHLTV
jgi:hypothetical protein